MRQNHKNTRLLDLYLKLAVGSLIAIFLILVIASIKGYTDQVTKVKNQYEINQKLQNKYDSLQPERKQNQISTNLYSSEQQLRKNYKKSIKKAFGGVKSINQLDQLKGTLTRLFGSKGYLNLRTTLVSKNGREITLLASKNLKTDIAFSKYDIEKNQLTINGYTEYDLTQKTSESKSGICYFEVTYDLTKNKAINSDIFATNIEDY